MQPTVEGSRCQSIDSSKCLVCAVRTDGNLAGLLPMSVLTLAVLAWLLVAFAATSGVKLHQT